MQNPPQTTIIWADAIDGGTSIEGGITGSYLRFSSSDTGEEIFIMVTADFHVEFFTKLKNVVDTAIIGRGEPH